ncbi:hypothetical protein PYCCODRAFT_1432717 [Trametes coccinea BRFM310]|uniref:Uncharacterized protein n=1 Tax=Trametes coccinea (strain BRFM310) TaxID=1353009 RepID=A0A1Y2IYE0_TRAC3|nr:hypothetical protein PYCCODRAFT_1432717 [Trametes coccinea BRFM310]
MRDTRRQLSRLNEPSRESLKAEWTTYVDRYEQILNGSDTTASKLAAVIDVYLALQGNTEDDKEGAMITELTLLRAELERPQPDFTSECMKLSNDMKGLCSKLMGSPPRDSVASQDATPKGNINVEPVVAQSAVGFAQESPMRGRTPTNEGPRSLWSFLLPAAVSSPPIPTVLPHVGTNTSNLTQAQVMAFDRFKQLGELGANGTSSRSTGASRNLTNNILAGTINGNIQTLEAQAQQFSVFSELTQHLKNEIGAYLLAFKAAKAYPTMEKKRALTNMHARVASSSAHWRQCVIALTEGYTRVQK